MKAKKLKDLEIPRRAKYRVHTPSGTIMVCEKHKNMAKNIYHILGCHVHIEEIEDLDTVCMNCVNEMKAELEDTDGTN